MIFKKLFISCILCVNFIVQVHFYTHIMNWCGEKRRRHQRRCRNKHITPINRNLRTHAHTLANLGRYFRDWARASHTRLIRTRIRARERVEQKCMQMSCNRTECICMSIFIYIYVLKFPHFQFIIYWFSLRSNVQVHNDIMYLKWSSWSNRNFTSFLRIIFIATRANIIKD